MSENSKSSLFEKFTPVLLLVSFVLAFLVGALWTKVSNLEKNKGTTETLGTETATTPALSLDQIKQTFDKAIIKFGKNDSGNVFIEVSDPSCPFCHIAAGKNPELSKEVGDRFKYVSDGGTYAPPVPEIKKLVDAGKASYALFYKNGHGNGEMGAKAFYCAFEQGKFWEVHDKLFSNAGYKLLNEVVLNDKSKSKELTDFLQGALDTNKLKECLDSGKYDKRLSEEETISDGLGVSGTPGFYLNTKNFPGAYSWKDMESSVQ